MTNGNKHFMTIQVSWDGDTPPRKLEREIRNGLAALGNKNIDVVTNPVRPQSLEIKPTQCYFRKRVEAAPVDAVSATAKTS